MGVLRFYSSSKAKGLILGTRNVLGLCLSWNQGRLEINTVVAFNRQERNLHFRFKKTALKRGF